MASNKLNAGPLDTPKGQGATMHSARGGNTALDTGPVFMFIVSAFTRSSVPAATEAATAMLRPTAMQIPMAMQQKSYRLSCHELVGEAVREDRH